MRELILRHAFAAHRHGSFTSSTLAIARWNHSTTSHIRYVRHKSESTSSTSASTPTTTPATISPSVSTGQRSPVPASTPISTPASKAEDSSTEEPPLRYGKATSAARPPMQPLYEPDDQPELNIDREYAVSGLVTDLASTRPPPLELPEAPHPHAWPYKGNWDPKRWDFKYLFRLGKAYGKFYWTGVKQLGGNFKMMFRINRELNGTFPDAAARYAAVPEKISYNDYELMVRTRRDMRKTIPFLLIFAIFGEFTPLIILAFGSKVVPGTCVIPKQILQDRKKTLERDDEYMGEMVRLMRRYNGDLGQVRNDRQNFIEFQNLIAYQAGLTPFKTLPPVIGGLYWHFRTQKNLARHCDHILSAATLVEREGGWSKKSPQDMWEWGNRYGLYRLHQWTRSAMERGEDPVSEKMKAALLPHFEREVQNMFQENYRNIPRVSHCTIALNSPIYDRPDINLRRREIQRLAGVRRPDVDAVESQPSQPKK